MTDDITKEDLRAALSSYLAVPTPPRAKVVIDFVPDLIDELDVKDERIQELNGQIDILSESVEDLQNQLKLANAKLQRGVLPEIEPSKDHAWLLEMTEHVLSATPENTLDARSCLAAIPGLLAENARLRVDSDVLRKMLDAAAHFVGLLGSRGE